MIYHPSTIIDGRLHGSVHLHYQVFSSFFQLRNKLRKKDNPPPKKTNQDFMVHVSIAAHLPWPTKVTFVHRLRGAPEASKGPPTPAETPSGAGAEPRETQRLLALEVRNLGREIRWSLRGMYKTFQNNGISMDFNYQPQLAISSINSWSWQSGMCFTLC